MPFTSHLGELRNRLIVCLIALGIGFAISYGFSDKIFLILMKPLIKVLPKESTMIFTGLTEAFFTYLKLSFISGIFLAFPVILYEIWKFVAPALYENEKKYLYPFILLSTLAFVGGALFGYFIIFPVGFHFFLSFSTDYIRPLPAIKDYLSLSIKLLLAFGIVFELPLAIFLLSKIGLITPQMLSSNRPYAIVLIFIISAILTPPDVATQIMMAIPLLILYEISVLVVKIFGRKSLEVEEGLLDAKPR